MGEMYDAYTARLEAYKAYQEKMLKEHEANMKEYNSTKKNLESIKERTIATKEAYIKFCSDVKDMLLSEALYSIYSSCLAESAHRNSVAEQIVYNYVKENGYNTIVNGMAKTYALEMVQQKIDDAYEHIMESVDEEDPETFKASVEDKVKFLDGLNNEEDIEEVKQAIALRVANAEEEFINSNVADKYDMDTIISDTKARIDAAKEEHKDADEKVQEAIKQEAVNYSKQLIGDIRENRVRNVYEQIFRTISESVVTNEALQESYYDNNKINMDKVNNSVKCMYGFLETVNTLQITTVDEAFIDKMLKELVD